MTRSKEDLKAEIKEAFPNAKEIKDKGDRMTFTMPNGSHIVVDMKNEIVLTDKELAQAKKDHHIDDNGNVVVEGYAEARGKDAYYIALAQGSREGTGFHEVYHIAEDAVLTDREKAAIKKAIPDAEERADKYAEWVEARKHGRGTAWGKLFQKIKDFAAKMKTIITGAETVNDIFRQIESGKVWERETGDVSQKYYALNKDVNLDKMVPILDLTDTVPKGITNAKYVKKFIQDKIKGNGVMTLDKKAILSIPSDPYRINHLAYSSKIERNKSKYRARTISILNAEQLIKHASLIESIPNKKEGQKHKNEVVAYHRFYVPVKIGTKLYTLRLVGEEKSGDIKVDPLKVTLYDVITEKQSHAVLGSSLKSDTLEMTGRGSVDTISIRSMLENVKDYDGNLYVKKTIGNDERRYAVRQDDQEEVPVKPQDIIDAINDIVHIYEGSRLTDKERKELRESSKFDPDHKQADRPQATELYDRRAKAGFNRMGYFNMSNYGRILALHLDNVMGLKGNLELTRKSIERQNKNAAEAKMNGVKEEKLSPSQARQRAVMDFGAMMIRNPELARETYPDYAKIFDEGLANHPDLKGKLDRVIKLNETYQGQTAAQRASGSIATEKEKTKLRSNPKKWLHEHFTRFYTEWVDDKTSSLKSLQEPKRNWGINWLMTTTSINKRKWHSTLHPAGRYYSSLAGKIPRLRTKFLIQSMAMPSRKP